MRLDRHGRDIGVNGGLNWQGVAGANAPTTPSSLRITAAPRQNSGFNFAPNLSARRNRASACGAQTSYARIASAASPTSRADARGAETPTAPALAASDGTKERHALCVDRASLEELGRGAPKRTSHSVVALRFSAGRVFKPPRGLARRRRRRRGMIIVRFPSGLKAGNQLSFGELRQERLKSFSRLETKMRRNWDTGSTKTPRLGLS